MASFKKLLASLGLDASGFNRGIGGALRGLDGLDRSTQGVQRSISKRFLRIAGSAAVVGAAIGAFSDARKIILDFDQAVGDLGSILASSDKELRVLSASAKDIGARSAFTATQVVGLQTELAKLGFSTPEILKATEAIGNFSIAVGAATADAARVGGGVMRAFRLETSKTADVVSTLAVATTRSALDFSKLDTALSIVGPIAATAGDSLERTTSLLGVLTNRSIDASIAGTSLRNIYLQLAAKGLTWSEAMGAINNSTNKVSTALEIFGVRAAASALIIAESEEEAFKLQNSITGVNAELDEMIKKRLDTVKGQTILLRSAWEGLVLSIEDGTGALSRFTKLVLQLGTGSLNSLTNINEGTTTLNRELNKFSANLARAITSTNVTLFEKIFGDDAVVTRLARGVDGLLKGVGDGINESTNALRKLKSDLTQLSLEELEGNAKALGEELTQAFIGAGFTAVEAKKKADDYLESISFTARGFKELTAEQKILLDQQAAAIALEGSYLEAKEKQKKLQKEIADFGRSLNALELQHLIGLNKQIAALDKNIKELVEKYTLSPTDTIFTEVLKQVGVLITKQGQAAQSASNFADIIAKATTVDLVKKSNIGDLNKLVGELEKQATFAYNRFKETLDDSWLEKAKDFATELQIQAEKAKKTTAELQKLLTGDDKKIKLPVDLDLADLDLSGQKSKLETSKVPRPG